MRRAEVGGATISAGAAAVVAAAVFAGHGSSDGRLFWIGIAALAVVAVGWIVRPVALSAEGAAFLGLLGALVVWQALSIHWSITPAGSWDYANRGLVYLAFACVGALLGSLPRSWVATGLSVLLGALLVVALSAKVVPAFYEDYGRLARLRFPVDYWNELALLGVVALVIGLWLAGRRERPLRARVAGTLHVYAALVVVVLTFSRFGILLAVLAIAAWLWVERDRLDGVPVLVAAVPGAAVALAVGLALPGIRQDGQPHSTRVRDGLVFGAVLVVCAVAVALAARVVLRREGDLAVRRRLALAAGAALVGIGVVAVVVLVVRAGGPVAFVQDRWHEFAATQSIGAASRLGSASSGNRWMWWQEAWHAFTGHPGGGTGAGSFALTSTNAVHNSLFSTVEPHNVPLQFLSETGIVGFLLYAGTVGAVVVAFLRGPRDRATLALGLSLAVGVVHSIVDIDWNYVSTQSVLFVVAGVVVARPAVATEARRARWLPAVAVSVCCLAAAYSLFAPWLSDARANSAVDRFAARDFGAALDDAKAAHSLNPLALEPLYLLAGLERSRRYDVEATKREPTNPNAWYELGLFDATTGDWAAAYASLDRSWHIDPYGPAGQPCGLLDRARFEVFHRQPPTRKCTF
jgi:O-antigen ligase